MNWMHWIGVAIAVVFSFWIGKKYGENSVVMQVVHERDKYWHKNFLNPWIKKYNRMLQAMAEIPVESYCDSTKRNALLTAENERLRRKSIRLAFKYAYFRKKYEDKPTQDMLYQVTSTIAQMAKLTGK